MSPAYWQGMQLLPRAQCPLQPIPACTGHPLEKGEAGQGAGWRQEGGKERGLERLGEAGLLGVTKAKQRSDIQRGRLLEQTVIW